MFFTNKERLLFALSNNVLSKRHIVGANGFTLNIINSDVFIESSLTNWENIRVESKVNSESFEDLIVELEAMLDLEISSRNPYVMGEIDGCRICIVQSPVSQQPYVTLRVA